MEVRRLIIVLSTRVFALESKGNYFACGRDFFCSTGSQPLGRDEAGRQEGGGARA